MLLVPPAVALWLALALPLLPLALLLPAAVALWLLLLAVAAWG